MCKLSIITINYNNAYGLQKTLESVACQTFSDYEQIIIDGGSDDGSLATIQRFNSSAIQHFFWQSEPDSGIYDAMNKGIKKAAGEYCFFLNSGDFFDSPIVLESVFSEDLTEDVIYGNLIVCLNGKIEGKIKGKTDLTFLDLYNSNIVKHQSAFIKRSLFNTFGYYNEELKIVSDWEFFLKTIGLASVSYRYVNIDIACFDNNGVSNHSGDVAKKERAKVLENHIPPMLLKDYKYFEQYYFLRPALRYKISYFMLRLIAKCTKEVEKIRKY